MCRFVREIAEFVSQHPAICGTTEEDQDAAVGDIVAAALDGMAIAAENAALEELDALDRLPESWTP